VYSAFIVLLLSSFAINILLLLKNKKMEQVGINLALEKYTISVELQKLILEKESKSLEETDGFIRFMSESREQAFKYIEDVQLAIEALAVAKRGSKEFNHAYKNLISLLPEKGVKND
jgi:intergrase/recombinase